MFYKFHCDNCGDFEIRRSILDDPLTECPKCGGEIYQVWDTLRFQWKGRFRFMKSEPEVDIEKIEAEQNAQALKQAKAKVYEGVKGKHHSKYW